MFKVGYTFSNNPLKRIRQYISHNPEIDLSGIFEVPNKHYEKMVQYEVKKIFPICKTKGQKEWFLGNIFSFEIEKYIQDKVEVK